jgi:hypothetical protein
LIQPSVSSVLLISPLISSIRDIVDALKVAFSPEVNIVALRAITSVISGGIT